MAHQGKATAPDVQYSPEAPSTAYSNSSVHSRLAEYTSMGREIHGPEWDPTAQDLDGEVVMRVGGGKKHGRYWIGHGTLDTASTPTLSEIRARSTSLSPAIRSRPDTTQSRVEALQVISVTFVVSLLVLHISFLHCNNKINYCRPNSK